MPAMTLKVGALMPIAPEGGRPAPGWNEIRRAAEAAEESGLDSIWVYDHLLFRTDGVTQGIHEAWTMLAALAAVTRRVEIGALVMAMPFRNPALLAKMAATADEVAAGRLILGVGTGWHEPEFDAFGYPFDHRVARFEEALAILVPLLRGDAEVSMAGRYHRTDRAVLAPRPPARPDGRPSIPLLIAGKGPRMLSLVARHADAWNTAWLGTVDELEPRLAPLRDALRAGGRDPSSLEITVGVNVVIPDLAGVDDELPGRAISGSSDELAEGIRGYARAGVGHLVCAVTPTTPPAMARLAEASRRARE
jgi:probable F420-dependent oxidoreductase